LAPFEEVATTLKGKISRDERAEISQQVLQHKLRKDFELDEKEGVKTRLFGLADSTLQQGAWKPAFADAQKHVLFKLKNKPYTAQQFLAYVQQQGPSKQAPEKYLTELYNNFIDESILQLLEADIINRNPEYKYLLNEYYEGILLFEIMEKEIWNKASEDSLGQVSYFNDHRNQYTADERVKAVFYSSSTPGALEPLKAL